MMMYKLIGGSGVGKHFSFEFSDISELATLRGQTATQDVEMSLPVGPSLPPQVSFGLVGNSKLANKRKTTKLLNDLTTLSLGSQGRVLDYKNNGKKSIEETAARRAFRTSDITNQTRTGRRLSVDYRRGIDGDEDGSSDVVMVDPSKRDD